jgi:hypothetical protein
MDHHVLPARPCGVQVILLESPDGSSSWLSVDVRVRRGRVSSWHRIANTPVAYPVGFHDPVGALAEAGNLLLAVAEGMRLERLPGAKSKH